MMLNKKLKGKRIILASKSPRRKELLSNLGLTFEVQSKEVEEIYPKELLPVEIPAYLAELKAAPFLTEIDDSTLVISSDTIVHLDGEILGKPKNHDHAIEMISKLSGKKHQVVTGVCILSTQKKVVFTSTSDVYFSKLSQEEIEHYVSTYSPYDKAGAYGIQEWIGFIGIERIDGSYFNVMGLPIQRLYKELMKY